MDQGRAPRSYRLYGLRVRSGVELDGLELPGAGPAAVELLGGSAPVLSRARRQAGAGEEGGWFRWARLADGSDYLRWSGLFEFLVSADGRRIAFWPLDGASADSLRAYLAGQVLSFALLKQGIEPLHATVVAVDGGAVAFMGDCGRGKSTLAAGFLREGARLLTDDLLVVEERRQGFLAHAGPARIKLFPEVAGRLLGEWARGAPLNPDTSKALIPLPPELVATGPVPLRAIYALARPTRGAVRIRPLSGRRAFLVVTHNTFNPLLTESARLARQFRLAARLVARVPVRWLAVPRDLARLPEVRRAILEDLARIGSAETRPGATR